MALSFLILDDVPDAPRVRIDLPALRLGDTVVLNFRLTRRTQGRSEVLDVRGDHKVINAILDATGVPAQVLHVSSTAIAPAWRAVKNEPLRKLGPARFPKTTVT